MIQTDAFTNTVYEIWAASIVTGFYYIGSFCLAIVILVGVHESGHYFMAKAFKTKIDEFTIGFGPSIWSITSRKGTRWAIRWIPLGGAVKMAETPTDDSLNPLNENYYSKLHPSKRILILVAGPLANFLLAWVLLLFLSMQPQYHSTSEIGYVTTHSKLKLEIGDKIERVGDTVTHTAQSVAVSLIENIGKQVSIEVRRDEQTLLLNLDLKKSRLTKGIPVISQLLGAGISGQNTPARIDSISTSSTADKIGLQPEDVITHINGEPIYSFEHLRHEVLRGMTSVSTIRTGKIIVEPSTKLGVSHDSSKNHNVEQIVIKYNLKQGLVYANDQFVQGLSLIITIIKGLFTGVFGLDSLQSPIGIADNTGNAMLLGVLPYISLLSMLSLNLGVMNLLPLPILDGGQAIRVLVEWVVKKGLSNSVERIAYSICILGLLLVTLTTIWYDLRYYMNF
ncbi:RIP metalloprotease RseP [Vibrio splendidus]